MSQRIYSESPREMRICLKESALGATAQLVDMTRALVRSDSQTPPSDTREVTKVAASFLENIPGVEVSFHMAELPVMNMVARLRGGEPGRRLILSGHLDTYPVGDRDHWSVDPMGGDLRDGRVYGRGSSDMKGGVAVMILIMQLFAQKVRSFSGELILALAGDEESMGELGTQYLIDTIPGLREDAVIVADVSSPSIIRCGEKGMIWLELTATGKPAHGAHVHLGSNAVERLMAAVRAIKSLETIEVELPADVAKAMIDAQPLSEPLGGEGERDVMSCITVNVGQMEGGLSANLVPDLALARLDIRLPMGTRVAQVEEAIAKCLAEMSGISWTVLRRYEPTWTPLSDPIVQVAQSAAAEVLGQPVAVNMRVGASDARLWRRAGVSTIVCGLTPHNLGGPDEYADIRELGPLAAIHALTAWDFLSNPRLSCAENELNASTAAALPGRG